MKGHKITRQTRCAGCLKSIMLFVLLISVKYLEIRITKIFISRRHYASQFGLLIIPHIQYMHNATTSCIRSAWKKSHKFSLISCGHIWNSCVSPLLLYSGGTWPCNIEDLSRLTVTWSWEGYVLLSYQIGTLWRS